MVLDNRSVAIAPNVSLYDLRPEPMPDRDVLSVLSDTHYAELNALIIRAWTKMPNERPTAIDLHDFCTRMYKAYPGGDAPLQKHDKGYHGWRLK
jgi:hypothetical protein